LTIKPNRFGVGRGKSWRSMILEEERRKRRFLSVRRRNKKEALVF